MKDMLLSYFDQLCTRTKSTIDKSINVGELDGIVEEVFRGRINGQQHVEFHRWYLSITGHPARVLNTTNFFHGFKRRYSLQGITNVYLDHLEANKEEIISLLVTDPLTIYQRFFHQAQMTFSNGVVNKNLISFFTKIAHTVSPHSYSALDNPIKKLFHMREESFFVAYCVVNETYSQWIPESVALLQELRHRIRSMDNANVLQVSELSDFKLIDMIFWWRANVV